MKPLFYENANFKAIVLILSTVLEVPPLARQNGVLVGRKKGGGGVVKYFVQFLYSKDPCKINCRGLCFCGIQKLGGILILWIKPDY